MAKPMDNPTGNPIAQAVVDLVLDISKEYLSGLIGKIRLLYIKYALNRRITKDILRKYGNDPYYNDFDHFLQDNNVICNIIRNCSNTSIFQYKARPEIVTYYVNLFIEEHPNYRKYHHKVRSILKKYFEIIYLSLNKSSNRETQIICNTAKELSLELRHELEEISSRLDTLDAIKKNVDNLVIASEISPPKLSLEKYVTRLLRIDPRYPSEAYLKRLLFSTDNRNSHIDSLDAVLQHKRVLLLGEAGYGKTYESITLLYQACNNIDKLKLIPIFFSLREYGLLYPNIISGIKYKLAPFCDGEVDLLIQQDLTAGRYLLILDGIDDIDGKSNHKKFQAEFNSFTTQYNANYFFVTSRYNRYTEELFDVKKYHLSALSKEVIFSELRHNGIYTDIPEQYYSLFSNPLFLSIGKSVLKQHSDRQIFNRSKLFEALFQILYSNESQSTKYTGNYPLTYHDALNILGNFAYQTFEYSSYSYIEFDQKLSELIPQNKTDVISYFVASGIFKIENEIVFIHKLLKEYCVAYFLVNNFPLSNNIELYADLIEKEEWKEVFIFASGIVKSVASQDSFLDFVMEHDLSLYIECVNAKSDINKDDESDRAGRLLTQIFKTYRFILSTYLAPIEHLFDPISPLFKQLNQKIGIIGTLSSDQIYLKFRFDYVPSDADDVQCINEQQFKEQYDSNLKDAAQATRRFVAYTVNLQRAGMGLESGRKIAIDQIKSQLDLLIKSKKLFESVYLSCERITCYQRRDKELKHVNDLIHMQSIVDDRILYFHQLHPSIAASQAKPGWLFQLQRLVHSLNENNVSFSEHVLPGPDIPCPSPGCQYPWDFYSKEQREKRIALFFYFHELSYLDMVKENFPKLARHFRRYNDAPYQVIVEIDHCEDIHPHDYLSEPSLLFYHIASPTPNIPMPVISEIKNEQFSPNNQIFQKIQDSYSKQSRSAHHVQITQTGFSFTTYSPKMGTYDPLSDYVYRSIKESLEDVFGSF